MRVLRTWLLWWTILAIPVQGIASVMVPHCLPALPAGHGMVGVVAVAADGVQPGGHGATRLHDDRSTAPAGSERPAAAAGGHGHDLPAVQAAPVHGTPVLHGHAPATAGDEATPGTGHEMLSCCAAGAMAVATALPRLAAPSPQASMPLHRPVARYRGVVLDGPERPPRPLPA